MLVILVLLTSPLPQVAIRGVQAINTEPLKFQDAMLIYSMLEVLLYPSKTKNQTTALLDKSSILSFCFVHHIIIILYLSP